MVLTAEHPVIEGQTLVGQRQAGALLSVVPEHGDYATFLDNKAQHHGDSGFEPLWIPDFLFPFQKLLVEWAIRKGRAAILADCGLGKTVQELVWAQNVYRKTLCGRRPCHDRAVPPA